MEKRGRGGSKYGIDIGRASRPKPEVSVSNFVLMKKNFRPTLYIFIVWRKSFSGTVISLPFRSQNKVMALENRLPKFK